MKTKYLFAFIIMLCSSVICIAGNTSCELVSSTLRCELKDIRDVKDIVNELFEAGKTVYDNGILYNWGHPDGDCTHGSDKRVCRGRRIDKAGNEGI